MRGSKPQLPGTGAENIGFIRMEATTNLIGGQPFSVDNLAAVKEVAGKHNIPLVFDGSLISENAYLVRQRESRYANTPISEIIRAMMSYVDILYLSGRKSAGVRGGLIATNSADHYNRLLPWLPVYEGFATYGGMSTKEVEAMAVGLREMCDLDVAGSGAEFVRYFVDRLCEVGVPVVTPAGGLACHIDARRAAPTCPRSSTPQAQSRPPFTWPPASAAWAQTISTDRDREGNEVMADLELARLAVPRRVYTMSHIEYAVDRLAWLYQHQDLIGGLKFVQRAAGAAVLLRSSRAAGWLGAAGGSLQGRVRRAHVALLQSSATARRWWRRFSGFPGLRYDAMKYPHHLRHQRFSSCPPKGASSPCLTRTAEATIPSETCPHPAHWYSAESHWELLQAVTGLPVAVDSPAALKGRQSCVHARLEL